MSVKLVAGVDSSTQACKIMIRDLHTGKLVRSGIARHRAGTEISPDMWLVAFRSALEQAGGLQDVVALSIGGQQHGMVALDEYGQTVRDAILWNDTRSAADACDLIKEVASTEVGGREFWAREVGTVPVASLTVSKVRWMAREEPQNIAKTRAIALPHDWLTWKITGQTELDELYTDRSEASGTGYFSPLDNSYKPELLKLAAGDYAENIFLPKVAKPNQVIREAKIASYKVLVGPGCGDNAGAALGLGLEPGEVAMSLGTSGVVSTISNDPTQDITGYVCGFADATGRALPLACTLNASRVIDHFRNILGLSYEEFSSAALAAPPGAEGLIVIPYFAGERTPNFPTATGSLLGINSRNLTKENIARAAIEGVLCGVGAGINAMRNIGVAVERITLIGGSSQGEAIRKIAPAVLGLPVNVPEFGEYVADGAAKQAAWIYAGDEYAAAWAPLLTSEYSSAHIPFVMERYEEARNNFVCEEREIYL